MITGKNNKIECSIFYALNSNLESRQFMQCSGIILKITPDLHLVLILLCQVRPFATRRLVKQDNGRSVRRIYVTGTIGWQNSALDRRKFYDIKFKLYRSWKIIMGQNLVYTYGLCLSIAISISSVSPNGNSIFMQPYLWKQKHLEVHQQQRRV